MTIEEIKKLRKEIDEALETLGDAMVNAQNALDQLNDSIEEVNVADRNLSEEEFAQWTAIGFRVGARFRIDGLDDPLPMTVTGISSEGFILTTADGKKKYPVFRRYLKLIDRFHLVEDDPK